MTLAFEQRADITNDTEKNKETMYGRNGISELANHLSKEYCNA